ncbi:hypothetical protein RhiJN_05458 [Ceratobasidium sp. AG-Ba]|nr:hypothetical protein RhiJN_05458 [Ceratobasidium sp. AG-Ba]
MSLLLDKETFRNHVCPQAGIRGPTRKLPAAHRTSDYLSISPIKFKSENELLEFFRSVRTKNPTKYNQDDSKLNNNYSERTPNRGRADFEQARLLYHGWYNGRHALLPFYGLPPLSPNLRFAYLAFTPWIDPNSYNIRSNEEEEVLDIGWYESGSGVTHNIVIEDYDGMSKNALPKANFAHGEGTILSGSALCSAVSNLFTSETPPGPLVLITYDWPRTSRLLKSHGIDTSAKNWHIGVGELLGFEQRGRGHERERNYNYPVRNEYRRRDLDGPSNGIKPKREIKEESNPYNGRWDQSSPMRKRSLSPRSRSRPLDDQSERKYTRPLFNPPEDKEEGELSSQPPPTRPNTVEPEIYVIDIRHLFSIVLGTPEPREYILYPACARRLGFEFDGWCAGNQAVRQAQLKMQPGLPNPAPPAESNAPVILEGKAGESETKRPIRPNYQSDGSDDEDW